MNKIIKMSRLPKILVVDDDPDIVEILRYNLALAGYDVESAINGKEAIKKATTSKHKIKGNFVVKWTQKSFLI